MTVVFDALLAMPMYPWVAHLQRLHIQYVMSEVPVHYYGWIQHIPDEILMSPTADLALIFLRSTFWKF